MYGQIQLKWINLLNLLLNFIPHSYDFRYYGGDNNGQGSILFGGLVHGDSFLNRWKYFIPENGKGWTRAGVVRLNASIRTYVYCILGAQAQTRAPIVNASGKSLDAQSQVLTLINDAVVESKNPSRVDSIKRYQDSIDETHSKLDFALGSGLYLIPSDMILKIGNIVRWNNNIQVADASMSIGKNSKLNREKEI
jgi:hypothetical protein